MNRLFIAVLLLIALQSCGRGNRKTKTERFNDFVNSIKPEVVENLKLDNRISKSNTLTILNPYSLDICNYCGVFVSCHLTELEFNEEIKRIEDGKIHNTYFMDSCLVKVSNLKNSMFKQCNELFYVPSSDDSFNRIKESVNQKTEVYILKSQRGQFLSDAFIDSIESDEHENRQKYLRTNLSNGVFVNRDSKAIIYWAIIF